MSASGYKQTFQGVSQNVRFAPQSGHCPREIAVFPESGHWMTALPPKADIGAVKSRQRPLDVCFNKPGANGPSQTAIHDSDQKHTASHEGSTKCLEPWD